MKNTSHEIQNFQQRFVHINKPTLIFKNNNKFNKSSIVLL